MKHFVQRGSKRSNDHQLRFLKWNHIFFISFFNFVANCKYDSHIMCYTCQRLVTLQISDSQVQLQNLERM